MLRKLFEDADRSANGIASRHELKQVFSRYDDDEDGALSMAERAGLEEVYPQRPYQA